MTDADSIIKKLGLVRHPEGGHYRETYRSELILDRRCLPAGFGGNRSASTAILFLLSEGEKSSLHRLRSDEVWHFYLGGPLDLSWVSPAGEAITVTLGKEIEAGHAVQVTVPARAWMGARPQSGAGFCLVGCTVAPGFDFADFEMGNRDALLAQFPHLRQIIGQLTD